MTSIIKRPSNPRYANDYHTKIAYDAEYVDKETNEVRRKTFVEVWNSEPMFHEIVKEFGDQTLIQNKNIFLSEREKKRSKERSDKQRQKDYSLFQYKSNVFDYKFIHETKNKKIRRAIRKAQSIEEARLITMALFIGEMYGLEPQYQDVLKMLEKISDDEE